MTNDGLWVTLTTPEGERGFAMLASTTVKGELPAAGDTAPAATNCTNRTQHHTDTAASCRAFSGVSIATWRRRLAQGKVTGAYKAAGAAGEQWFIPVTALDQIAVIKTAPVISADTELISELQRKLDTAENQLAVQRALADERLKALDQLHATMRALGAGLQAETAPADKPARRWFKRK
jgi:hypothetical protein